MRIPVEDYRRWTAALPGELMDSVTQAWGEAPGKLFVNDSEEIVLATITAGNVVLLIQPPRGFGENPVAIYHDPDLAPSHHYLAAYRWLEQGFKADAVVHLGKHGSMEWLPGKNAALSASCATDAAIGNLPLVYPFLVNDPGEGAQAKRRAHATIVDHLIPPMARAESYGDIARLEQLLDEHANIAAMDPAKLPAIRGEIWQLMHAAEMHRDLGLDERPDDEEFDDFILHVDGWLCEIKDAQIRDGLHVLGQAPAGEARVNLVLAILRAAQVWGGQTAAVPGLRAALGLKENAEATDAVDRIEAEARDLVQRMEDADWSPEAAAGLHDEPEVQRVLQFAATQVVPRLGRTTDELDAVLHALDGGFIPAGPSGSPLRGLVNVLPTGRNFYTVDPRAVPSRLAWDTGVAMAESLVQRYVEETGSHPESVGLSVWGTSAMRTSGDDIAEVLALLGVRPVWDEASRRVGDLVVVPLEELGRPRIDVTVRISGFFRDAFPHVVAMLDDAVQLVANLDEPLDQNFVRAHAQADLAEHGDERRATTRIFGSKPGSYGAGILQLVESGSWRDDNDLAEVYTSWGGFAYGRGLEGAPAADDMRANYRRIKVAAKNIDTREHDIADSDDYFQYHGGMVATVRALTGSDPKAYVGDSTSPTPYAPGRCRRRPTVSSAPGWSTRGGSARCSGTVTRAPSSWPPPSTTCSASTQPPAWCTTGCTTPSPRSTSSTRPTRSSCASRTRGRCAASSRSSTRPLTVACGRNPTRRSSRRCSRSTSSWRATWRTARETSPHPRRGDGTAARDSGGRGRAAFGGLRAGSPEILTEVLPGRAPRGSARDLPAARRRAAGRRTRSRA